MQRTLLILLVTALVAAGGAAGTTLLLTSGDDEPEATPSPSPEVSINPESELTLPSPSPAATADPGDDNGGDAGDDGSDDGGVQATPSPTRSAPPIQSARSVDCDDEPRKCSKADGMVVTNDNLEAAAINASEEEYADVPTVDMVSEIRKPDGSRALPGDEVGSIHVVVTVENTSSEEFVFAAREVVLQLFRDSQLIDTYATSGEGFVMPPGATMTGTFDRPIINDGTYTWQAKTWYYAR